MPKTLLSPATKSDHLFLAAVAYRPDTGSPVCGRCWSQLDYDWGKGRHPHVEHPQLTNERAGRYVDESGVAWLVWEDSYRCANPLCDAKVLVRTLPAKLTFSTPYHPDDLANYTIDASDPLWQRGDYNEWGQFVIEENGETLSVEFAEDSTLAVEYEGVWAYIDKADLETPPNWTYTKRKRKKVIKVNTNSKRFQHIVAWFAEQGYRLSEPEE